MTNLPCDVIRDLLPLYVDGVCSEESKAAVEAHLESCEACKAEYQRLLDAEQLVPEQELNPTQAEEKQIKALRRVKRNLNKRRVLAVVLTAVVLIGIGIGLYMLTGAARVILPYDATKMRIEEMTPENAEKANIGEVESMEDWVDLQISEAVSEYYTYLAGKHFTLEENGETIHAAYFYFGSSLRDYLMHGGKGNFREERVKNGLPDSFPDGYMHWGISTLFSYTVYSDLPVEPGFFDGDTITRVEEPPEPGLPYLVTKEAPVDRIYYLSGPHLSFELSNDRKLVEQYGVLIWERRAAAGQGYTP